MSHVAFWFVVTDDDEDDDDDMTTCPRDVFGDGLRLGIRSKSVSLEACTVVFFVSGRRPLPSTLLFEIIFGRNRRSAVALVGDCVRLGICNECRLGSLLLPRKFRVSVIGLPFTGPVPPARLRFRSRSNSGSLSSRTKFVHLHFFGLFVGDGINMLRLRRLLLFGSGRALSDTISKLVTSSFSINAARKDERLAFPVEELSFGLSVLR